MIPRELKTEKGLRYFNYGFILSIVSMAMMGILIGVVLYSLANSEPDRQRIFTAFMIWVPFTWFIIGLIISFIIMFVAWILFLNGVSHLISGNWEFGSGHISMVQKGTVFITIGALTQLVGFFGLRLFGPYISIAAAILLSLGLLYLIQELTDEVGIRYLTYGCVLFIAISIINAIFILLTTPFNSSFGQTISTSNREFFFEGVVIPIATISFNVAPFSLFLLAYRRAYLRVRNREIEPSLPSPPMPMVSPILPHQPITAIQKEQTEIGIKPNQ